MESLIAKIKEDFKEVIKYSQNIPDPKVDDIFDKWYENKQYFIKELFHGELIYEVSEEVYFEMSEKDKQNKVEDFITYVDFDLFDSYFYPNKKRIFIEFLDFIKNSFFNNIVPEDFVCEDIYIQKNSKIVRSFKFFIEDEDVLNNLQSKASRIIQKNKIKGKLCLSVHPLDFLSSSENNHNWRSCHALDGDFRAGNISYMTDSSTIICYLKSDSQSVLPNFPSSVPWNSKKWRVLLHFSENRNLIFAGRPYPFSSNDGMNILLNKIRELTHNDDWLDWDNSMIRSFSKKGETLPLKDEYISIGGELIGLKEIIKEGYNALMYNDLLHSHFYRPYYTAINKFIFSRHHSLVSSDCLKVGEGFKCLDCGCNDVDIASTFRCISCEEEHGTEDNEYFAYCDRCGARTYTENMYYVYEGDYHYCDYCYNELMHEQYMKEVEEAML